MSSLPPEADAASVISPVTAEKILQTVGYAYHAALIVLARRLDDLREIKKLPTSYQTLRFHIAAIRKIIAGLESMSEALRLVPPTHFIAVAKLPSDIATSLTDSETEFFKLKALCKLEELPPGNPGEKEFERLLKPLIAANKAFETTLHLIADEAAALSSPTYKLDLSEEERAAAWREARTTKLSEVLTNIDEALVESEKHTAALRKQRAAVVEQITNTSQMTFADEIDPAAAPEVGGETLTPDAGPQP